MIQHSPIGVFDSGYGGLTVLREIVDCLPEYDYIYLGDNARAPYGSRSYDAVYRFTLESVKRLFEQGCQLVILACNTASAKALRTIQQKDLPHLDPQRRVLGVIRPSAEMIDRYTKTRKVGILGTLGTVNSMSYPLEINKLYADIEIFQEACPMWVPLIENNEHNHDGADYFVSKHIESLMQKNKDIDSIILGCTHYPLLEHKILKFLPSGVTLISQGKIVATSLNDYLHRHPEMEKRCSKNGLRKFLTTDDADLFNQHASIFYGEPVISEQVSF